MGKVQRSNSPAGWDCKAGSNSCRTSPDSPYPFGASSHPQSV